MGNFVSASQREVPFFDALATWWPIPFCVLILSYFTVLRHLGATLGLRVLRLRLEALGTGRPPGWGRSLARAVLSLVTAAFGLYTWAYSYWVALGNDQVRIYGLAKVLLPGPF